MSMKPIAPMLAGALLTSVMIASVSQAQIDEEALRPLNDAGFDQLSEPLRGLSSQRLAEFEDGLEVFTREFDDTSSTDGGGPLSNNDSCDGCHGRAFAFDDDPDQQRFRFITGKDGGGGFPRASQATAWDEGSQTCDHLEDLGGPGYQDDASEALQAILDLAEVVEHAGAEEAGLDEPVPAVSSHGVPVGPIDDRTSNDLFGLGLIDAISDFTIARRADPNDRNRDGISGRVHRVTDHHGRPRVGRFGRKAEVADLDEFNAEAFQNEQGVTNLAHLSEGIVIVSGNPDDGYATMPLEGLDGVANPEVSEEEMHVLNMYVKLLAPPQPNREMLTSRERRHGQILFRLIGCADCHTPSMRTGWHPIRALSFRRIAPYSDFLLHDLGPENAEGCKGRANPQEWRTEPLWGLRFVNPGVGYMHDGRADSIQEAIEMHGGEAALSSAIFGILSDDAKLTLVKFLLSL